MNDNTRISARQQAFCRVSFVALAAALTLGTGAAAAPGVSPRVGVYGCMDQDGNELVTLQWGIIDASNYSNYDGKRGRYSYDPKTNVLVFTSGFFKGLRRLRTDDWVFRVLDEKGAITAFNCPWTPKSPLKLHW